MNPLLGKLTKLLGEEYKNLTGCGSRPPSWRCPDMENCINELMRDTEGAHAKAGLLKKMAWCLMSLGIRHQITNWIEEVKVLMVERLTINMEVEGLVGVDGLREELVSLLANSQKKLKVVSIIGLEGVRKQASFLKNEHDSMKSLLEKIDVMDKLDPSAKNGGTMSVRCPHMENYINDLMRDTETWAYTNGAL
ncbi:hypothetical protein VPH35_055128 [Triticum aestivum]|uniref:Uncharacterized protein n=2 Tax=Triticum TaxID=4564 RepID=A0A9R1QV77_TRITD|nr:unnamed protein product [Triticum aestivum]VAH84252.1 unnamed protein product [Triticum turgidum subsp. durum]